MGKFENRNVGTMIPLVLNIEEGAASCLLTHYHA